MRYLIWFWHNMYDIRRNIFVRIVAGIGQIMLGLLSVFLCKRFVDETIRIGTAEEVIRQVLVLVGVTLLGICLRQMYYHMDNVAFIHKVANLRLKIFSNLFKCQLYDDKEMHSGDVTSRLAKDIELVSEATAVTIPQMIVTIFQLLGSFLLMRSFDAQLAWILVIMTPLAIVFGKLIARRLRQMTLDIRQDESQILMQIQEGIENNALLRSLQSEQWVSERLGILQQRQKNNYIRRSRFTTVTRFTLGCVFGLGYLLAFIWGAIGLRSGAVTFGVMTSFLQLVGQIQQPIISLLNMTPQLIHSTASVDRLKEMDTSIVSTSIPSNTSLPDSVHPFGIRATNLSFHYATDDKMILNHFTYNFRPGSKTALMGETGIGKTTLFRLMLAFVNPVCGEITIYGDNEQTVSEHSRQHFVFVPQGNSLMSGSIRYNLLLAKPDATEAELCQVLHTACADFVFDLAEGLDTELGERGKGLSEGQAQRIAIARGLLRPGTILLLDEISASLDETTEKELFTRIFAACPQRTMLFITHRHAVAELCDDIVKLKSQY